MLFSVEPIEVQSLKGIVVQKLESWILSGELEVGEKLPSERILAKKMKISRPVLHEALVDLAAKGLVQIEARRGVYINDYRIHGSCAILSSLLNFQQDQLDPKFQSSLIEMRMLIETETAGLAARHHRKQHMTALNQILINETRFKDLSIDELVELDFNFHLQIALASENQMYPLILNSFKGVYTYLTGKFFKNYFQTPVINEVFTFHQNLVSAIRANDSKAAREIMKSMLTHGAKLLRGGQNDS
jgi:DNA-binding FadR family transcriptional regulator